MFTREKKVYHNFQMRMTKEEYKLLQELAEKHGFSTVSCFVRAALTAYTEVHHASV